MMQIARFRGEYESFGKEANEVSKPADQIWDFISVNYQNWESDYVVPLYLTKRGIYREISLVVWSKSADDFTEFIINNITSNESINDISMVNLMEPRFFSIPKNLSQNIKRFTISLDVAPKESSFIFDYITNIKTQSNIVVTYIAYTYHQGGSILLSLLSGDRAYVEEFTSKYLDRKKGVIKTEIVPIIKSKNLATPKIWKDHVGKYFVEDGGREIEDLETYESWSNLGFE
ncbi:MAG: hypothetical protein JSW00_17860 [Thermoplasmata archaeon]|nr:MAG: hypothetical protein JSW00_17860 [Thermoplasmata archaeon]